MLCSNSANTKVVRRRIIKKNEKYARVCGAERKMIKNRVAGEEITRTVRLVDELQFSQQTIPAGMRGKVDGGRLVLGSDGDQAAQARCVDASPSGKTQPAGREIEKGAIFRDQMCKCASVMISGSNAAVPTECHAHPTQISYPNVGLLWPGRSLMRTRSPTLRKSAILPACCARLRASLAASFSSCSARSMICLAEMRAESETRLWR